MRTKCLHDLLIMVGTFLAVSVIFSCGAALAQSEPPDYVIGPNDKLQVFVWKEPELTRNLTVMADGRITFPLIGKIMASGRSVTDLNEIITSKLKEFVSAPEVTVILVDSLSQQIYTIGKLRSPGPYRLAPSMTVLQALSAARGFAEWADTKNVIIVRRIEGKELHLRFNYKAFIDGKNLKQNFLLKPNDTIIVP